MYQVYLSSEFWLSILIDLEITFHIVRCGDSYNKHSGGSDRRIGSSRPPSNYIQSLRPPWIHEAPFQHFLSEIKIKEKKFGWILLILSVRPAPQCVIWILGHSVSSVLNSAVALAPCAEYIIQDKAQSWGPRFMKPIRVLKSPGFLGRLWNRI